MPSKKPKLTFTDPLLNETFTIDSQEEIAVYNWCLEAVDKGLILPWTVDSKIYQPCSITAAEPVLKTPDNNLVALIPGVKDKKSKTLLRGHSYTPDFKITLTDKFVSLFPDSIPKLLIPSNIYKSDISNINAEVFIDVKGQFNLHGGDRVFSINQKWVYQQTGIFINKVVPLDLFTYTFVPVNEQYSKKKHIFREKYINCKPLSDILNEKGI